MTWEHCCARPTAAELRRRHPAERPQRPLELSRLHRLEHRLGPHHRRGRRRPGQPAEPRAAAQPRRRGDVAPGQPRLTMTTGTVVDEIRDACAWVSARARSVHIDKSAIAAYAAGLPLAPDQSGADPDAHLAGAPREELAAFWLTLDAI